MKTYQIVTNDSFIEFSEKDNPKKHPVIFFADGRVIGSSGKQLKNKPANLNEILISTFRNRSLQDAIAITRGVSTKSLLDSVLNEIESFASREGVEFVNTVERLLKITLDYHLCEDMTINALRHCLILASQLAIFLHTTSPTEKYKESEVIKWLQSNCCHVRALTRYDMLQQFKNWHQIYYFWSCVPPIEYPYNVKKICETLLNELLYDYDKIFVYDALKSVLKSSLIQRLEPLYRLIWNTNNLHNTCEEETNRIIQCQIIHTIKIHIYNCSILKQEPNFNGNFLTKFAQNNKVVSSLGTDDLLKYAQIKRPLFFEDEYLQTIIPITCEEFTKESERQHNCLAIWHYDKRVIKGHCNIVFIRKKNNLNKNYITCEINPNGDIVQWFFKSNNNCNECGNDESNFKNKYQEYLKSIWHQ